MMKKADKIRGWSICESCLNNAGGCSWTEEDPVTHRIRFEPVPGWTAQPTTIPWGRKQVEGYFVTDCPRYRRNPAFDRAADRGANYPRPVIGIEKDGTKTVYRSSHAAARALGVSWSGSINTACAPGGERLTVLGRHWRFAPDIGTQPCMRCPRMFFCGEWTGCEQFKAWADGQKGDTT